MNELTLQQRDTRLDALRDAVNVNGIDHIEVASSDQRTLRVTFVHPLPGESGAVPPTPAPVLEASNILIDGGVRVTGVRVVSVSSNDDVLTVVVDRAGDFSTYHLRLVTSAVDSDDPPFGFDPFLADIDFRFKVECPSDLDCVEPPRTAPTDFDEPALDYLAKDYRGFRRQILERLSAIMPAYRERNPADMQIMLVELLAYLGDELSYYQDAVATEAYLGTARRRVSLKRHARLLDYQIHQGANARAWVHFRIAAASGADNVTLVSHTPVLTGDRDDETIVSPRAPGGLEGADVVWFETLHDQRLHAANNSIEFYRWSGAVTCLPEGSTSATLTNTMSAQLEPGDALLLEEVAGPTGRAADADPEKRWVVRLTDVRAAQDPLTGTAILNVQWHSRDALPFDLCLAAEVDLGGGPAVVTTSIARGNIVLADQGRRTVGASDSPGLVPAAVPPDGAYRPRLDERNVTIASPYDHRTTITQPAVDALVQAPAETLPAVSLFDGDSTWTVQKDLLASDRFASDFTVEIKDDGIAHLRFGDDQLGKKPGSGGQFIATYRVGSGTGGNVGADSLRRIVTSLDGFQLVCNPLPAKGASDPETAEEIRRYAPQAFRVQKRAVTVEDWARVAESFPEVQKAQAHFRWTGSWYTVFVTVDRQGGQPVVEDARFLRDLLGYLDRFRVAGYDLEIRGPVFVPIDVQLRICLAPGFFTEDLESELMERFSSVDLPDARRGFFHPDNFTFGQPLYVSSLYAAALELAGIDSVEVLRLQRFGGLASGEIAAGVLKPAPSEILRCDTNPSLPENGAIDFEVLGGT